jgi:hypothetical protein
MSIAELKLMLSEKELITAEIAEIPEEEENNHGCTQIKNSEI